MKSTKLLTTLLVLFVSSTLFAQKVHYKDSYYTIVKSKIFHRGHDVFGRLTAGKIDTIYMIAKELYDERGKLKEQYKNKKKRDRYKLPEDFWEQKNIAVSEAANTNENKVTESTVVLSEDENQKAETIVTETNASAANTAPKIIEKKVIETIQKEEVTEDKKTENIVSEDKKVEKEEVTKRKKEKEKVAKHEKKQEKGVNTQKEEAAKREKAMIVKEKRELEKDKKLVRNEEKKAVMKEKIKQQKEEKKEKVNKHENEQKKQITTQKEEATERKGEKEKRADKKATKKTKNNESKELKDQKSKTEKAVAKEKSAEKNERKQSLEAKKIEKKNKGLEKEKNVQLKKQKSLETLGAALLVSTSISNNDTFGTIYIKVNKEKTSATKNGDILLFFDVINNSNEDLVILKPNNSIDSRLDFFSKTMECGDIPITSTDYITKDLKIKDEDYLTIPANAKIELFVNGKYRNWLACNSEDIILQIQYNPFKNAEEGNELQPAFKKELSKSLKKITPIKIESENIKFKLNKQE